MKLILISNVDKLGKLGDQVNVRAGYARNFLLPQKKAVLATKKNMQYYSLLKVSSKHKSKEEIFKENDEKIKKIQSLKKIDFFEKVGKQSKLFGSINQKRISERIKDITGISLKKREIILPNGSLRSLGVHDIQIKLQENIFCKLEIEIKKI